MSIFTTAFAKAAGERAVKTFAQTEAALLVADGTGVLNTDWSSSLSAAAMAAVISLLTSIASDAATGDGPSLTNAEVLSDAPPVVHNEGGYVDFGGDDEPTPDPEPEPDPDDVPPRPARPYEEGH